MADNVAITAGSGTTIAADDVGAGLLVQRVKTTWGPDGTANDADVATGKPLPTQIRSATGLVPIGEPTDAKNTATDTTSVSAISILKQISSSAQSLFKGYSYETVAASQTAQVMGASGATGDTMFGILVVPATTSPGNVLLLDNATSITVFTGGSLSVSNLVPFLIPINAQSVSGAWKITTGANVSVIGTGIFS